MKYNFTQIGNRIRSEREKLNLSQEKLLENIRKKGKPCIGRNTLSKIENGDTKSFNAISLEKLTSLCEEFDCSISYLFGEYEYRNYDNKFIHEKVGLSEDVINKLHSYLEYPQGTKRLEILNILLENTDFSHSLLDRIIACKIKYNLYCTGIELLQAEEKKQTEIFHGNILEQIDNTIAGTYKPLMTRNQLNKLNTDKDASIYLTQVDFNNILKDILENNLSDSKTPNTN